MITIDQFYRAQHDFHGMLTDDKSQLISFIFYIYKSFDLSTKADRKKKVFKFLNYIRRQSCDLPIYNYLNSEMRAMGRTSSRDLEAQYYHQNIIGKIDRLTTSLQESSIDLSTFKGSNILDIGTERLQYLDIIQETLGAKVANGININIGFCHYDGDQFAANTKDDRFTFYDGTNINFPDKHFQLITMISVIHHIPTESFRILAKEIARVCSGYLFIKDVDITRPIHRHSFRVQHYLYGDNFLIEGDRSYFNDTVTYESTSSALIDAGFSLVHILRQDNFNGTYYALFQLK